MELNRINRSLTALFIVSSVFASSAAAGPLRFAATEAGSRQSTLEIQSDELVTMTALPFRLVINRPDGKPLTGAKVRCDLTMPLMPMPENRPQVVERDGAYAGEMILTCTMGDWRLACVVEDTNGVQQTVIFDIGPARMK